MSIEMILSRRSVREYTDEPVSDSDLKAMLDAAMAAPSAMHTDPWHFIVLRNRAALDLLADGLPYGKMLKHAPLGIIVCGDMDKAHRGELSYLLQDCSAAIENLLLGAHLQKLGAVWLGVHPNEERMDYIRKNFEIPEGVLPLAAVAVGHPAEHPEPRTRYTDDAVHFERW